MEPNDKKLEAFVNKLMANDKLEQPATGFTNQVLGKLNIESKIIVYKPLISKWVWLAIAVSVIFIVAYALLNHQDSSSGSRLSEFLNLQQMEFRPLQNIDFNFSKTLIYATVVFAVMIGLQVPLLKSYLNRKIHF